MVEITRRNLARGNIITAVYLDIQRVNNEKGEATFENAEIMPLDLRKRERDGTVARMSVRAKRMREVKKEILTNVHSGPPKSREGEKEGSTRVHTRTMEIDSVLFCARVLKSARTSKMCRDI